MGDSIGGGGALRLVGNGVPREVMNCMSDTFFEGAYAQATALEYREAIEKGEEVNPDDYTVYLGGTAFRPVSEPQVLDVSS